MLDVNVSLPSVEFTMMACLLSENQKCDSSSASLHKRDDKIHDQVELGFSGVTQSDGVNSDVNHFNSLMLNSGQVKSDKKVKLIVSLSSYTKTSNLQIVSRADARRPLPLASVKVTCTGVSSVFDDQIQNTIDLTVLSHVPSLANVHPQIHGIMSSVAQSENSFVSESYVVTKPQVIPAFSHIVQRQVLENNSVKTAPSSSLLVQDPVFGMSTRISPADLPSKSSECHLHHDPGDATFCGSSKLHSFNSDNNDKSSERSPQTYHPVWEQK